MINRIYFEIVKNKLNNFPAVGLLGARQIGKTTLAKEIAATNKAIYLDLENYKDLAKLDDPIAFLGENNGKLIILDEIQRKPDLFMTLRGLIDAGRRAGHRYGQFLILGSASIDLLRQAAESLAGRICYIEMSPITVLEYFQSPIDTGNKLNKLWLRGGFPDSLLASSDQASIEWRQVFIKTYLERDLPQFGPRIPAETLRRLWIMLAHLQGTSLNAAKLAASLGISAQTVARYIDLLVDLFLVRKLHPWHANVKKRLVRSPKVYVRDSGMLHVLLNISTMDDLITNSISGASWEGFVIDNLISFLPIGAETYFYRTIRGAEIDFIIKHPDGRIIAIEIKRSSAPKAEHGFHEVCNDINPTHRFVVYNGEERFPLANKIEAIGLNELMQVCS